MSSKDSSMQLAKRKFSRVARVFTIGIFSASILASVSQVPLFADLGFTADTRPASSAPTRKDELRKAASWAWPTVSIFEQHLLSFMDQRNAPTATRDAVQLAWNSSSDQVKGPALLDRLLAACGVIEPRIAALNLQLSDPTGPAVLPRDLPWLSTDVPGWMQDTIRLACGRALAQRRLYDEALETLTGLELVQVCDPASLLFYRATCEHHLLKKKECLANVKLLLERESELPVRFTQLAHLMAADIEPLKSDSLDEIARLMNDVQRRLDLGRAGKKVRDEEGEIVKKLDKLIEDIENQMQQQQQQQQQQQNNGQQNQAQSKPMEDSQIAGGKGPGDVDQKKIGDRAGWGNLPPAQRQEALQRLTEELPSHYREVIEGYFRQLAKDNNR
jgi:hypothetical protein